MNQDQLSNLNPNNPLANPPSDLYPTFNNEAIFVQPVASAVKSSARQQVLDRILESISKRDLLGKSYVEQYLRHKYRRNCKSNTLRQAATSLVQFLSFFANSGNTMIEQLSREDIEA
jgi:hypothetical protein